MFSIVPRLLTLGTFASAQGFVSMEMSKVAIDKEINIPGLSKRTLPETIYNQYKRYVVEFTLGEDKQSVRAIIDTGSSDLWVYSNSSKADFSYDPSKGEYINDGFDISYFDGNEAKGKYYKDILTWGDASVKVQFGVTDNYRKSLNYGVFGIGSPMLEASVMNGYGVYDNYPQVLRKEGKIESASYSLDLNNIKSKTGTLLFGAIDTSRYQGKLQLLDNKSRSRFHVKFSVEGHTLVGSLDCGASYTYLPDDIVAGIAASVNAVWHDNTKSYILQENSVRRSLKFDFSGTIIEMPTEDLLTPIEMGSGYLQLSVMPMSLSGNTVVLGDSFLRSAYVVFDIDHNKMAIAQVATDCKPSNYVIIPSSGIPIAEY